MKLSFFTITLGTLALTSTALAQGRMTDPRYQIRCTDAQALEPQQCADEREKAKASGCITPDEYNYLVSNTMTAICAGPKLFMACPCSCFEASTLILTSSTVNPDEMQWTKAKDVDARKHNTIALTDDSRLSNLAFVQREIKYTTSGPEKPSLYVFALSNGRTLRVTEWHALLLNDGSVVAAKDFKQGQLLVDTSGNPVEVLSISREKTDKHVFNLLNRGSSLASHLIVAEGVVVGDLMWQNTGGLYNKIALRK
jgi:hypothetical protein